MSESSDKPRSKRGKKVRVPFRRNRSTRRRESDWTRKLRDADDLELEVDRSESITAKGDLSRRRTIIVNDEEGDAEADLRRGVVVAVRGLYADVDGDDRLWPCTVRRVLRTRLIEERHPVTVGDRVRFRIEADAEGVEPEGVIEAVEPRQGELKRKVRKRVQTIVANVDQAIIVSSALQPAPKPHLIDRFIVAALAGDITPVICMNKIDLDEHGSAREIGRRYDQLGYKTLCTSAVRGDCIDELREILGGKENVIAGQSGVGKSSILNAVQPGLKLKVGDIIEQTEKGRHTTSTARLIRLQTGGYVVDTPGVKSFDLSIVARHELEAYFAEFVERVPDCKFPDCTHTHEGHCAVKQAVESGAIHPQRYESYVRLFEGQDV